MAKYKVLHRCGHEQAHELIGPMKERIQKIKWLRSGDCTNCWKSRQRKKQRKPKSG